MMWTQETISVYLAGHLFKKPLTDRSPKCDNKGNK